jgi:hypothetical protein
VSPVKYELGFYIPEEDILHSHRHENPKSYNNDVVLRVLICGLQKLFSAHLKSIFCQRTWTVAVADICTLFYE